MNKRNAALAAVIFLAAACSDPTGPCNGARACEVTGVDLAIVDARIVEGERIGTDQVTRLPVYRAGPVTIEFTIVNRGDSISGRQPYTGTDFVVPPLAPGEIARVRISEDFTDSMYLHPDWRDSPVDPRAANIRSFTLALLQRQDDGFPPEWPVADSDPGNNTLESPRFHVAMPVLTATMGDVSEIRENAPFVTSFRIENASVHGANAPPFDVVLCIDYGCNPDRWTYFARFEVPGIDAGWHYENAYLATLDVASMSDARAARSGAISLCIVTRDDESGHIPNSVFTSCVVSQATITRPDYERCAPPVIQIGVPHVMAQPNCGGISSGQRFFLFAIDAVAGRTYLVDAEGFPLLYDADGEYADQAPGRSIAVAESGRYYILFNGQGPVSITVTQEG